MITRQETKDRLASYAEDVEHLGLNTSRLGHSIAGDYIEFDYALAKARANILKENGARIMALAEKIISTLNDAERD